MDFIRSGGRAACLFCVSASASAQSVNFVVNTTTGPGSVLPSTSQGGAALQTGIWSRFIGIVSGGSPIAISNLAGSVTPVTLTVNATTSTFGSTTNGNLGSAPADQQALLSGVWAIGGVGQQRTLTFNNLWNGNYDVYTYAMAPDNATFITTVRVNGANPQPVGGTYNFPILFALNVTHSLHTSVSVTNGTLSINAQTTTGQGSIAGVQLVLRDPPTGACCVNGLCILARQADCTAAGGTYQGNFVTCASATCPATCQADITGNGTVNIDDLVQVITSWGPCP